MSCPEKFRKSLVNFEVDEKIIQKVNEGYESITDSFSKKDRACFFK